MSEKPIGVAVLGLGNVGSEVVRIIEESATEPPSGTYVTVKFTIDSKGRITEIIDVATSSSEQGKESCISAITLTAPYGDWTDDMIAILGNSQEMAIKFYYE